jgi:hypothetical protein
LSTVCYIFLQSPISGIKRISVLEYWSIGVLKKIDALAITPTLQYSNAPRVFEIEK